MKLIEIRDKAPVRQFQIPATSIAGTWILERESDNPDGAIMISKMRLSGTEWVGTLSVQQIPLFIEALQRASELQ